MVSFWFCHAFRLPCRRLVGLGKWDLAFRAWDEEKEKEEAHYGLFFFQAILKDRDFFSLRLCIVFLLTEICGSRGVSFVD